VPDAISENVAPDAALDTVNPINIVETEMSNTSRSLRASIDHATAPIQIRSKSLPARPASQELKQHPRTTPRWTVLWTFTR
jgi:hypothetical protein